MSTTAILTSSVLSMIISAMLATIGVDRFRAIPGGDLLAVDCVLAGFIVAVASAPFAVATGSHLSAQAFDANAATMTLGMAALLVITVALFVGAALLHQGFLAVDSLLLGYATLIATGVRLVSGG